MKKSLVYAAMLGVMLGCSEKSFNPIDGHAVALEASDISISKEFEAYLVAKKLDSKPSTKSITATDAQKITSLYISYDVDDDDYTMKNLVDAIKSVKGVEKFPKLQYLEISLAWGLSTIDLSGAPVTYLKIEDLRGLTSLTLNKVLGHCVIDGAGSLQTLKVGEKVKILEIDYAGSTQKPLNNLTFNGTSLEHINMTSCVLNSLDISKQTSLAGMRVSYNKNLKKVDVSKNKLLPSVDCSNNPDLETFVTDKDNNKRLVNIFLNNNNLKNLQLGNANSIVNLSISNNQLYNSDFAPNNYPNLKTLQCGQNKLSGTLKVDKIPNLTLLYTEGTKSPSYKITTICKSAKQNISTLRVDPTTTVKVCN